MINNCHLFQIFGFLMDVFLFEIRFHNCTSEVVLAAVWFSIFSTLLSLWFVNLLRKHYVFPPFHLQMVRIILLPFLPVCILQPSAQKLSFSLVNCVISSMLLLAPPPPVCLPLLSLSRRSVCLVWIVEWETVRTCSSFLRVMAAVPLQ